MDSTVEQQFRGEEELRTWNGHLIDEENEDSERASFKMTDSRLVCLTDDDQFKDIGYSHISSIESESETKTTHTGKNYRHLIVVGILFMLPGAWIWSTVTIWMTVVSVLLGLLMLVAGWEHRNDVLVYPQNDFVTLS